MKLCESAKGVENKLWKTRQLLLVASSFCMLLAYMPIKIDGGGWGWGTEIMSVCVGVGGWVGWGGGGVSSSK